MTELELQELARSVAASELGWWQAHHRQQPEEVKKHKAAVYQKLFGLNEEQARSTVELFFQATKEHDIAEELEDKGDSQAVVHWQKVEELLAQHFVILLRHIQKA